MMNDNNGQAENTQFDRIASDWSTFHKYATSQIPMKAKTPVEQQKTEKT